MRFLPKGGNGILKVGVVEDVCEGFDGLGAEVFEVDV